MTKPWKPTPKDLELLEDAAAMPESEQLDPPGEPRCRWCGKTNRERMGMGCTSKDYRAGMECEYPDTARETLHDVTSNRRSVWLDYLRRDGALEMKTQAPTRLFVLVEIGPGWDNPEHTVICVTADKQVALTVQKEAARQAGKWYLEPIIHQVPMVMDIESAKAFAAQVLPDKTYWPENPDDS